VIFQIDNFEITTITHQVGSHFFIEDLIDLKKSRIVTGDSSNRAADGGRAIARRCDRLGGSNRYRERRKQFVPVGCIFLLDGDHVVHVEH
jgi:hypothetical protein